LTVAAILAAKGRIWFILEEEDSSRALRKKSSITRLGWLAASLLAFVASAPAQSEVPPDDVAAESVKFADVYGILEANYMDPIEPDRAILEGGIRGMLTTLDPFSSFFNPSQFELLKQQEQGKALGFGSILYVQPGKVTVLEARENSPASRAGLGPGDEIVEVNGTRLDRLDFQSLVELLERSRSQTVRLAVIHPGIVVPVEFKLDPAEVALPTVDKAFLAQPGIGYIHLGGFEQNTPLEVASALDRMGARELQGLILDLRDNPGGLVNSAVQTASLFLSPGSTVLTVKGRATPVKTYSAISQPERFEVPLLLMVNGNTASAAEILVAALEENGRALVVGEPTYGKGVVQNVLPLSEKCGLALTSAQYLTPTGRSIQRPLEGTQLAEAFTAGEPAAAANPAPTEPRAASGQPTFEKGGIIPNVEIPSPSSDAWLVFLNGRGLFTDFASDYLTRHERPDRSFEPADAVLDEFKDFLHRQGILTPEEYWLPDQARVRVRIKTEVVNLVFGLAIGDEVETLADPEVQKAVLLFPQLAQLIHEAQEKRAPEHFRAVGKEKQ
jgi:carboxyl-terminal processing protease